MNDKKNLIQLFGESADETGERFMRGVLLAEENGGVVASINKPKIEVEIFQEDKSVMALTALADGKPFIIDKIQTPFFADLPKLEIIYMERLSSLLKKHFSIIIIANAHTTKSKTKIDKKILNKKDGLKEIEKRLIEIQKSSSFPVLVNENWIKKFIFVANEKLPSVFPVPSIEKLGTDRLEMKWYGYVDDSMCLKWEFGRIDSYIRTKRIYIHDRKMSSVWTDELKLKQKSLWLQIKEYTHGYY